LSSCAALSLHLREKMLVACPFVAHIRPGDHLDRPGALERLKDGFLIRLERNEGKPFHRYDHFVTSLRIYAAASGMRALAALPEASAAAAPSTRMRCMRASPSCRAASARDRSVSRAFSRAFAAVSSAFRSASAIAARAFSVASRMILAASASVTATLSIMDAKPQHLLPIHSI